jgi:hypothetical protein
MRRTREGWRAVSVLLAACAIGSVTATRALAHCDTVDGPVVADARLALGRAPASARRAGPR